MEYLKDFDFQLLYHPGKANILADALSRKKGENQYHQVARLWKMTVDLVSTNPVIQPTGFIANLVISNDLIERVKIRQVEDNELISFMEKSADIKVDDVGIARFNGRLCVPKDEELRKMILEEAHRSKFSIHLGVTKMYQDLKRTYWWISMKRDVADFVSKCLTCQQVKADHQLPGGLLKPLEVPEWKWECVTCDFVSGLPRSVKKNDAI